MHAMILAAGRGTRMRPLTDHTPKPLLAVGGKPLIVWHIERLVAAGYKQIVINHAWLGAQIEMALGDGQRFGATISYSAEQDALETAGGIAQALPLLGSDPFMVINGDVWCDWDAKEANNIAARLKRSKKEAWLLLVDNPSHHTQGDFHLDDEGLVHVEASPHAASGTRLTFAGIGIYHPSLFYGLTAGEPAPLAPLLRTAISAHDVLGSHHRGEWIDVGTPERLRQLDQQLRSGTLPCS